MRRINWGVLGTAGIARKHTIPGMVEADNCCLYAIAGRNLEKAEQFRERFGFQKAYGSYEELLDDPQVEAVYIPLPNDLHYAWAMKAIEAGKHVLCEKPLAPTPEQMRELFAAARQKNVFLMEAFAYLHSPYMAAVKAEIKNGSIGEILYMESEFVTADYDLSNIRMRKETFGGSVYDLGCYCTSQILWMMGQQPERVQAVAEFSPEGIDTFTTALLRFPDGAKATLNCGMCLHREPFDRIDRFRIHGSRGSIASSAQFNQKGELSYTVCTDGQSRSVTVATPHNYRLEVEQLGRCILEGEKPWVSEEFSIANGQLMQQILKQIGYE